MNCSNCQNPIAEGEKFCGKCGSPVNIAPVPNIQYLPQQEMGSKKMIFVVVGIIALLVIISASAFWFFTRSKNDAVVVKNEVVDTPVSVVEGITKVTPNVPTVDTSSVKKDSFDFLGTKFVFDRKSETEKFANYFFYPTGENSGSWKQRLTVSRQIEKKQASNEYAKEFAKEMMNMAVANGAIINSKSEIDGTTIWIYTLSGKNNAVSINKMFAYKGEVVGIFYDVKINGASAQEIKELASIQLTKMRSIQDQFISSRVPFLWE